jgi:hypothetical protein
MGYTTEFKGRFELNRPFSEPERAYLVKFSETRRMKRHAATAEQMPDPYRLAVNLPIGHDAGYFVGGGGFAGQEEDDSILEYNSPPVEQPSLWCKWIPTDDGKYIEWSGAEKFYSYTDWLSYLINNFLSPWGYRLNGEVTWQGENEDDHGVIIVEENNVAAFHTDH